MLQRGSWRSRGSRVIVAAGIGVFERPATNEVTHDDAQLASVAVFESHDDHAVSAEAFAPPVDAVVFADAARDY